MRLQGFKAQAMAVTCDPEHKFDLAIQLGELRVAYQLAGEAEVSCSGFRIVAVKELTLYAEEYA